MEWIPKLKLEGALDKINTEIRRAFRRIQITADDAERHKGEQHTDDILDIMARIEELRALKIAREELEKDLRM